MKDMAILPTSESIGQLVVALVGVGPYCVHGGGCHGTGRTFAWCCPCPAGDLWTALNQEWRRSNKDTEDRCCDEHFPSFAMSITEQVEHYCPACGWSPLAETNVSSADHREDDRG